MDIKKILNNFSTLVIILSFPIYTYLVLSPNINKAVFNINKFSGIDLSNSIVISTNTDVGNALLNAIYFDTYQFFYLFTFAVGILGVLVMYKGRNISETILLYLFLVIPAQRKYWGIIYDTDTNKPLSLSLIRVYTFGGEKNLLIEQQVSDLDGKYRIDLPTMQNEQKFLLTINAKGYEDYRKEIALSDQNIIQGQLFDDIGLRKIGTSSSEGLNFMQLFISLRPKIYEYVLYLILTISFFSFVRAVYGFYLNPTIVFVLILLMYCYVFIWNFYVIWDRKSSHIGRVLDSQSMQPINGAKVEIQKDKFDSAVSDTSGNVKFANPGRKEVIKIINMPTYKIKNANENGTFVVEFNQDGILASDILLERDQPKNISKSPFSK